MNGTSYCHTRHLLCGLLPIAFGEETSGESTCPMFYKCDTMKTFKPQIDCLELRIVPALFADYFAYPDGLITNEFAHWNPTNPSAIHSPVWDMTSGSEFGSSGAGWTGVPDDVGPNATSSNGTNSAVFRLVTKQSNFGDVSVSFLLRNQGLTTTPSTPAVDWDGVHIFLRYQSEESLYYASINRRDN